jgi:hypothetical protein
MEVSLCIQQMHFQNTVKQDHLYPQSMLMATFSIKHVETRIDVIHHGERKIILSENDSQAMSSSRCTLNNKLH